MLVVASTSPYICLSKTKQISMQPSPDICEVIVSVLCHHCADTDDEWDEDYFKSLIVVVNHHQGYNEEDVINNANSNGSLSAGSQKA